MPQEQYLAEFKKITDEMYELTAAKNSDYSDKQDAFQNFRMVEVAGVTSTEIGFYTRMTDKMSRLGSFLKVGFLKVKDEKIEDTLKDLAVYCIIFILYLRSKDRVVNRENTD